MSAGSKPHGATYARSSSIAGPGPFASAGPTTVSNQPHSPRSAAQSASTKSIASFVASQASLASRPASAASSVPTPAGPMPAK